MLKIIFMSLFVVWRLAAQPAVATERLSIGQAVQEALENNLELMAERYNVNIADARLITARLRPNPLLSTGGEHLDLLGTRYSQLNGAGPNEAAVRLDFPVERGKKRAHRIEVAQAARSVAELQLQDAMRKLAFDVRSAFIDVLLAKENYILAQENLRSLNSMVDLNTVRVNAGDLAQVELVRSRVAAMQFQNAVRQEEFRLQTARNRLQLLLGRQQVSPAFDAEGELRRDMSPRALDDIRRTALERRPDLLALQRDHVRSLHDLRLQVAEGKVDYLIGTEYRRQQGINGTGNSLGFFVSTPLPIFNRNQGEIERARLEQQQIDARIRAMQAAVVSEAENTYQQYVTARTLLETIEKEMLDQASEARKITEYSYRRGEASLIEFLDAQRTFNETMHSYNEARAEYARSLYLIDSISGEELKP